MGIFLKLPYSRLLYFEYKWYGQKQVYTVDFPAHHDELPNGNWDRLGIWGLMLMGLRVNGDLTNQLSNSWDRTGYVTQP